MKTNQALGWEIITLRDSPELSGPGCAVNSCQDPALWELHSLAGLWLPGGAELGFMVEKMRVSSVFVLSAEQLREHRIGLVPAKLKHLEIA